MGIGAVGSEVGYYGYSAVGSTKPNESVENENTFGLLAGETVDETDEEGNCPKAFTGMSFADLFANPSLKANQIPVVNQIVSSKNPNDGEIYSGDNMQMASVKDYWLELFAEKTDK